MPPTSRILFVCLGNICRSPTAEGVFKHMVAAHPLGATLGIDSAGTSANHIGQPPDPRSIAHAAKRGVDLAPLRARQIHADDFAHFDLVVAMDSANLRALKTLCAPRWQPKLVRLLDFAALTGHTDVPDPYYGDAADFERVLDLVEAGCTGLLQQLTRRN